MNKLYQTLKTPPKFNLRFEPGDITLKCPDFIVKAVFEKPRTKSPVTKHWWDNYPDVDSVKYENKTIQYQS
jgi:hypothetical protein